MSDLRDQLMAIHDEYGRLTPEIVREAARPKGHPLHARVFDKTVREAAEVYYTDRAHELIRSCKLTYKEPHKPAKSLRAFQAVRSETPENGGYVYEPTERVAQDPLLRAIVLRDMDRDWQALKARYDGFDEFVALVRRDIEAA